MNEYLEHHGVKGQKKGQRRAEWYPIADYEAHLKRIGTIKKGTKFYRVSSRNDENDTKRRFKYVSKTKNDRNYYKGVYSQDIMFDPKKYTAESYQKTKLKDVVKDFNKSGKHLYEIQYVATDDIKVPTKKQTREAYESLIKSDPSVLKDVIDTLDNDEWFQINESNGKKVDWKKSLDLDKKTIDDIAKNDFAYDLFNFAVGSPNSKVMNRFLDHLEKSGFNAVIDDNDSGKITDKPLILINPEQTIKRAASKELSAKDIGIAYNEAMKNWQKKEPENAALYALLAPDEWQNSTFISGSSKTQFKDSGFYRKNLPIEVRKEIDKMIKNGDRINVGDAPGIDRQVQDYLKKKNYGNVHVYSPGTETRYIADKSWQNHLIDAPEYEKGSSEWLAKKDLAMEKDSDSGLAITIKGGAGATRNNVERLRLNDKPVKVYELDDANETLDRWLNELEIANIKLK